MILYDMFAFFAMPHNLTATRVQKIVASGNTMMNRKWLQDSSRDDTCSARGVEVRDLSHDQDTTDLEKCLHVAQEEMSYS